MAGFSIMLVNFIFFPLLIVIGLAAVAFLFFLGGLAAAGVIFLSRRLAGRQHDRTLCIRCGDAKQVTALLRAANVRRFHVMRSGRAGSALINTQVSAETDLEALMRHIASCGAGIQGMNAK